jgi:hypothetical protein
MALGGGSGGGGSAGAIRAGGAFVELFTKDNLLKRGLNFAQRKLQSFAAVTAKIGAGLAISGIARGGVLGFLSVDKLGDIGKLKDTADAFGLTAEKASGLFGVMKAAGSDTRDATEGLVTLGKNVKDSLAGTGETAKKLFDGLGVSAQEFANLDPADQFYKLHEALRAVQNPAQRVDLLLAAVGEDTGKNLIRTLSMTTDELKAQAAGFALTSEEMESAREASRAWAGAMASVDKVLNQVALSMAEIVKTTSEMFGKVAGQVAEFVKQNQFLVVGFAAAAAASVALGAALLVLAGAAAGLGVVLGAVATGLSVVGVALGVLLTPFGLVAAAVAATVVAFVLMTDVGRETFGALLETARTTFGGIADALKAGDLQLAWDVALAGLNVAWRKVIAEMTAVWNGFKTAIVDGWHQATTAAARAMVDMIARLRGPLKAIGLDPLEGADPEALKQRIDRNAIKDQKLREKARRADQAGADADLAAAEGELRAARDRAAKAAADAGKKAPDIAAKIQQNLQTAGAGARGAFSAIGPRGFFGSGSSAPLNKIAGNSDKQLKVQEQIRDELKKGGGLKFV